MRKSILGCVRRWELSYRRNIDRKIFASIDRHDPAGNLHSAYLRARCKALQWAIRHGHVWIPHGLQVVMFLALEPGDTFLDIGANVGRVTERGAYLVGHDGGVYSFEPSPSSARYLRRRVNWLGLRNVTINEFAIAPFTGNSFGWQSGESQGGHSCHSD